MIFNVKEESWRKIGVYCITNLINNKIYIGSTTTNFRHRYLQYKSGFLRNLDNQPILYKAFRKYGFENFSFTVICIISKEEVIVMEQFYINRGTDYNSCLIAGSLQGFKHPLNSKTKTIIKGNHHCARKIDKYDLKGNYIETFNSIVEALENIKKPKGSSSHIRNVCLGKLVTFGGFKWAYHGELLINRIDYRRNKSNIEKRVSCVRKKLQFTLENDKSILVFNSILSACKSLKISYNNIYNSLKNPNKLLYSKFKNQYFTVKLL